MGNNNTPHTVQRGMLMMTVAVALFALMDALVKGLMADYSLVQVVFFRCLGVMVPLLIYTKCTGGFAQLHSRQPVLSLICSFCALGNLVGLYLAFHLLPLTTAYAILYTMPIWAVLLAVPLLKEKLGFKTFLVILVGFAGVVVMVNPAAANWQDWGVWAALAGTIFYAIWIVIVRHLSATDSNPAIVFSNVMLVMVVAAVCLPWFWRMPEHIMAGIGLFGVGVISGVAQILITAAFRLGPAKAIAPFEYTSMLWVVLLDWFFWQALPGASVFIGAVLVIASGLWIGLNEKEVLPFNIQPEQDPT